MKDKVDLFYDLFDEAAMLHYLTLELKYLDAFIKVSEGILWGELDRRLDEEKQEKLKKIYEKISACDFCNEEIRLALELLLVKGFKHENLSLDLMTPDSINYLFVRIISRLFPEGRIAILDTALGTGNLLSAVHNNLKNETVLCGIERDERLTRIACLAADLQGTEVTVYCQDALLDVYEVADVVIGDIDSYYLAEGLPLEDELYQRGVRYFPYLLLHKRLKNIRPGGYFIYLVDNDIFQKPKGEILKALLEKEARLPGLILLPKTIVQPGHPGKSILIGKKAPGMGALSVLEIPDFKADTLKKTFNKLDMMIKNIAEE